jgi:hypothetical protein
MFRNLRPIIRGKIRTISQRLMFCLMTGQKGLKHVGVECF